jgi:hypothetical protein
MTRRHVALIGGALLGAVCWAGLGVAEDTVSPQQAAQVVSVTDVSGGQDGTVSGTLVNKSPRQVRDVRLLIRHAWVWKDERHPGADSPGTAEYYVVHSAVPAGGSLRFTRTPSPPLPQRSDGHFETSVEVVGFEEVGE